MPKRCHYSVLKLVECHVTHPRVLKVVLLESLYTLGVGVGSGVGRKATHHGGFGQ